MPRHPSCALIRLTILLIYFSTEVALPCCIVVKERAPCGANPLSGHKTAKKSIHRRFALLVGAAGIEPATLSLSGTRSNQLSYAPCFAHRLRLALRKASPRAPAGLPKLTAARTVDIPTARLHRSHDGHPAQPLHGQQRMVEATGFEPATPSLQSSCSTN